MRHARALAAFGIALAAGVAPALADDAGGVSFFLAEQARYARAAEAAPPVVATRARHDRHAGPAVRAASRPPFERPTRVAGSGALFDLVSRSAARHGVPVALAHAVVRAESGYRCSARSGSGAAGIMQILPSTARSVGVGGNLGDCATGLEAGMRYLAAAYRTAGGSAVGAATLFNRGLGARPTSSAYARRVTARI